MSRLSGLTTGCAAAADLRHEIELGLEVQDAAIYQYYAIPPGGRNVEDLIMANSAVMVSLITTALYVRELASRWVSRPVGRVL